MLTLRRQIQQRQKVFHLHLIYDLEMNLITIVFSLNLEINFGIIQRIL